jgi:hypothetical protein
MAVSVPRCFKTSVSLRTVRVRCGWTANRHPSVTMLMLFWSCSSWISCGRPPRTATKSAPFSIFAAIISKPNSLAVTGRTRISKGRSASHRVEALQRKDKNDEALQGTDTTARPKAWLVLSVDSANDRVGGNSETCHSAPVDSRCLARTTQAQQVALESMIGRGSHPMQVAPTVQIPPLRNQLYREGQQRLGPATS